MKPLSNDPLLYRVDAHHRLFIALGIAAVVLLLLPSTFWWITRAIITWVAYAFSVLVLCWITIVWADPKQIRKRARLQDSSRLLIFLFVIVAAFASLMAVIALLIFNQHLPKQIIMGHVMLALLTVICSWWLVHTVFTMHYAHLYYGDKLDKNSASGGLNFPDEKEPDYLDFAYFSFVIGMTSQVSDVQVTARFMRRLALLHGVLSFLFNTVVVALSINVVSGLLQH